MAGGGRRDDETTRRAVAWLADPAPPPCARADLRDWLADASVDPARVLRLAADNGVAATVGERLLALAAEGRVDVGAVRADVEQARATAVFRELAQRRAIERLLVALAEAGVAPPVALKGAAARETLYPEPWKRAMDDVDLLLPPTEAERAAAVLETLGYRSRAVSPNRSVTERAWHATTFAPPAGGIRVDLHRAALRPGRFVVPEHVVRERARVHAIGSGPVLLPDDGDALLVTALHGAELAGRGALKRLVDLALLIRGGRFSWSAVLERACRARGTAALGVMLALVERALGTRTPPWARRALDPAGWRQRLLHELVAPRGGAPFAHRKQARWRELATLYLLPDGGARQAQFALSYTMLRVRDAFHESGSGPRRRKRRE